MPVNVVVPMLSVILFSSFLQNALVSFVKMECRYHHRLAGPSHSIFDRFNNVQSLEITSPFLLIIIIIIITMIALLSVSVGRFWQVCICVAQCVCVCIECYVKPFQRDRFDSWLHFSLAHKEYKQTQIMVSTLDSITSLCWCYMLFSRSGIFAHFVFMHTNIYVFFCFFFFFPRTLVQLLLFRFDLSAFGHWSICVSGVCVRARLSFNFIQVFPLFFGVLLDERAWSEYSSFADYMV